MYHSEGPVRKYEVNLTKVITGETEIQRFYALGTASAEKIIEKLFSKDEYRVNSINELVSVVKIMIEHPCPN